MAVAHIHLIFHVIAHFFKTALCQLHLGRHFWRLEVIVHEAAGFVFDLVWRDAIVAFGRGQHAGTFGINLGHIKFGKIDILDEINRIKTRNKQNAIPRWFIIMSAWTMLYNSIAQCCEKTAPILFRTIFDSCNLEKTRGIIGGFFDGPRAWQWVLIWLTGGGRRTKSDKDYYRTAERLQRDHQLLNGCLEASEAHGHLFLHLRNGCSDPPVAL